MKELCQVCRKHPSVVHQYDVAARQQGHDVKVLHLCLACAKQKGLPLKLPLGAGSLQELVSTLGKAFFGAGGPPATQVQSDKACPDCGWTLRDFQKSSRFGCAKDYEVFAEFVDEILERVHGTSEHPPREGEAELARLNHELEKAVSCENYEVAAQLRDQVRALEKTLEESDELTT